jgi:hypothetical protein
MISLITFPIFCISAKVNLSPRAKLHGAHDGATFPLMWGRSLLMRSSPLGLSVVPQWTQGCTIRDRTSPTARSQASILLYAWRKKTARPLSVRPYFNCLARTFSFCSGDIFHHLSDLLSRPSRLSRWQALHSYASPSTRDLSRRNISGDASISRLHRLQTFMPGADALRYFLSITKGITQKVGHVNYDGPHS